MFHLLYLISLEIQFILDNCLIANLPCFNKSFTTLNAFSLPFLLLNVSDKDLLLKSFVYSI